MVGIWASCRSGYVYFGVAFSNNACVNAKVHSKPNIQEVDKPKTMKTENYTEQTTAIAVVVKARLEVISCECLNINWLHLRPIRDSMDTAWVNLPQMNINAGWDKN